LYKSLYPSLIRQFNLAAHTQVGMLIIPDKIYALENKMHSSTYTRGGAFFEDFAVQNWLDIGSRWFGLMNYEQLVYFVHKVCMEEIKPRNYLIGFENTTGTKTIPFDNTVGPIYPLIITAPMVYSTKNFIKEYTDHVRISANQSF